MRRLDAEDGNSKRIQKGVAVNIKRRVIIGASEPHNPAWQTNIFPHASEIHSVVLYGPNSGQWNDTTQAGAYNVLIGQLHALGILAFAYVSTDYGLRSLVEVKSDIEKWRQLFPIDGYFLDECATAAAKFGVYQTIRSYIPAQLGSFFNFGRVPDKEYAELRASLCISERATADVLAETYPMWMLSYAPDFFLVIAYGANQADVAPLTKKITDSLVRFYCISAAGQDDTEPDYGVETELFMGPANPVLVPTPVPTLPPAQPPSASTENWSSMEIQKGLRAIGASSDATAKDLVPLINAMVAENVRLKRGISGLTNAQIVAEVGRRLP